MIINNKYLIIIILIILIIFIILYYLLKRKKCNYGRHLTNDYHYAHYSSICSNNILLYPELLFTNPINIVLKEGQSLLIPKKWWHWVTSNEETISINFWCKKYNKQYNKPFVINKSFQNNKLLLNKIISYTGKINNIDINNNDKINKENINSKSKKFIITLKGYGDTNEKLNNNLLENIKKDINIPIFFNQYNENDIDFNIWYATGNHDTGLHYDDHDGMITVLKGCKNIVLYPQKDSFYLSPYCVIPYWAKNKPIQFYYNTYEYIKELPNSLPSSRLLYELIMCYNNQKMLSIITDIINKIGSNKIVYGCKLQDNIFRCEMYFCHFSSTNNQNMSDYNLRNFSLKNNIKKYLKKNIIVHSFDLYNNDTVIGDEIHFYYNIDNKIELPHFGYGKKINNNEIIDESLYVLDNFNKFKKHYVTYLEKIKLTNFNESKHLLYKYNCRKICIHNKYNNNLFIQYLDISLDDFIDFLIEFNYPKKFIQHVKSNYNKYKDIIHEITIVYDQNLKPIKSAFYGLI